MKNRFMTALLAAALCLGLLAGCGGKANTPQTGVGAVATVEPNETPKAVETSNKLADPPSVEQMLQDVNNFNVPQFKEQNVTITSCELIKRQSNPERKEDIAFCYLREESDFRRMEYQFKLLYNYYDEGGWILDEMTPDKEDQWKIVYLDRDGNDVLDDIIWLDGFDKETVKELGNTSSVDGVYYFSTDYAIYDQDGHFIAAMPSDQGYSQMGTAIGKHDGELYFTLYAYENGRSVDYLATKNGVVAGPFRHITNAKGDLILIYDNNLYGAIDYNGNIVVPIQYEKQGDVDPAFASTYENVAEKYAQYQLGEPTGVENYYFPANGVYQKGDYVEGWEHNDEYYKSDVFDFAGKPILSMSYDSASSLVGGQPLIEVFRDGDILIYDFDGRLRAPVFQCIKTDHNYGRGTRFVSYNGRLGYLNAYKILSQEESE